MARKHELQMSSRLDSYVLQLFFLKPTKGLKWRKFLIIIGRDSEDNG